MVNNWLLLTGMICSFLLLVAGVSYNHISSTYSKFYMYLSGAYPLFIAFATISILFFIENIKTYFITIKNKIKNKNQS